METGAIDIHHHYVPERMVGEAKQHGITLGVEVFEDDDVFNSFPALVTCYPLYRQLRHSIY